MPLDPDELAELQRLIALADRALKTDNETGLNKALAGLRTLAKSPDPEMRRLANEAHDAANNANMAKGIADLAAVAEELKPLVKVLDNATGIATEGKESLFFPKVAKKAAEALDKVTKLKQDIEALQQTVKEEAQKVGAEVENIQELKDLPEALDKLKAALEKLKKKAGKSTG